jgi:hypothetical protein
MPAGGFCGRERGAKAPSPDIPVEAVGCGQEIQTRDLEDATVTLFPKDVTRKEALTHLLVLPALAGVLLAGTTAVARADSRVDLKYQSTPKNNQKCSDCVLFVPGKTAKDDGTCKIITGDISPNGWCTAFAQKPA